MMLRKLKARLGAATSFNSSRHHLSLWLNEISALGAERSFRVLDAGAGDSAYRHLFDHVTYESADFGKATKTYAPHLTYVCDLTAIPCEDERFDQVICTQVLEHVPAPVQVLAELRRVAKPGARIYASAPLFFPEHEVPYDFYRYTRFGWEHMAAEAGLQVEECEWLEGYFGTLAYQLGVAARALPAIWLPLRFLFLGLAGIFATLDMHYKRTDFGHPKNYRVVLRRPL